MSKNALDRSLLSSSLMFSALLDAATRSVLLSLSDIQRRNNTVYKQLASSNLFSIGVNSNGNCFFSAHFPSACTVTRTNSRFYASPIVQQQFSVRLAWAAINDSDSQNYVEHFRIDHLNHSGAWSPSWPRQHLCSATFMSTLQLMLAILH